MDKKKGDTSKRIGKKGPAKEDAQEDLELASERAQRVKGGAVSNKDKWMPFLSFPNKQSSLACGRDRLPVRSRCVTP